jgi:hypothetical protein
MNEELCWAVCQKCWSSLSAELGASTSFGRADAVRMLQAVLQVMLQGAGPVGYYLKVLKGVVSAGYYTCRAFCYRVLVPGRFIPGRFVSGSFVSESFVPGRFLFLEFGSWALRLLGLL